MTSRRFSSRVTVPNLIVLSQTIRPYVSQFWVQGSTSHHVFSNCIGCLSAGASSWCCIMHSVFNGKCPAFLSDIVQTVSASRSRLRLRSSSSTDYVLPRLRTKFGERAFSHSGPSAWNRLREDIRAEPDITNFRKLLKTHYFNSAFNVQ